MNEQFTGDIEILGTLTVRTPRGYMRFGGNELSVVSTVDDPSKLRLASPGGNQSGVSFNVLRDDGEQEEVALIGGAQDEEARTSLGGQLVVSCRGRNLDGDAAMRKMLFIGGAFTTDGRPKVRMYPNLEQVSDGPYPTESAPPPPVYSGEVTPTAIVSLQNLTGGLVALQTLGDNAWLIASEGGHDTDVVVEMPFTGQTTLNIEVRPTSNATPAPYLYVWVGGLCYISALPIDEPQEVVIVSLPAMTGTVQVRVHGSAQAGTIDIGGITAY